MKLRLLSIIPLLLIAPANAQEDRRPVLRAQHLGGDEPAISGGIHDIQPPPRTTDAHIGITPQPTAPRDTPPPPPERPRTSPGQIDRGTTPVESFAEPTPLDTKPTGEDAIRLQVFLDESNFGPGVIDGKPGRFTELAVISWNEVHGHPTNEWTAVNAAARKAVPNPFGIAIVPDVAAKWVKPDLPSKREEQAKLKLLPYRSYAEFMSERYHTDVQYLIEINGRKKVYNLRPRSTLLVPNVKPFLIEKLTAGAKHQAADPLSQRHAVVDTKINQVRIFEAAPAALAVDEDGNALPRANSALISSFPITPGKPKFIKYGVWDLKNMVELPSWRYDKQLLETGKRGKEALQIPPGPNVPVGVMWNGLSKPGIGLHGTSDPETIGRTRSAGCIRLSNWDVVKLPELIRPGATVEIR